MVDGIDLYESRMAWQLSGWNYNIKLGRLSLQQFRSRNDEILQRGTPFQHHCRLSSESCWVWCCLNCNCLPTISNSALKVRGSSSARDLGEIVPIYTMKAYIERGGITPLVLNLVTRWIWVAAARIRRYTSGDTALHKHWIPQSCSRLLGEGCPSRDSYPGLSSP